MLSTLTVKADNTPKQMGNISREMEILRNNLFKKTDRKLTEMINAFHGLISWLDLAEEESLNWTTG